MSNPFKKIEKKHLKVLLWGDSGVGKTTLALKFPNPVIIDLEKGAPETADVLQTTSIAEVTKAIQWLRQGNHNYETLIIDPITLYYKKLQQDMEAKLSEDFTPRDWGKLKKFFYQFIAWVLELDMNLVLIAREKIKYAKHGFMIPDGVTYDVEEGLKYWVDVCAQLTRKKEKGKYKRYAFCDTKTRHKNIEENKLYELDEFENVLLKGLQNEI